MVRVQVILVVKLFKGQLLLSGLCMCDLLEILSLFVFSFFLFLIVQIELNSPVLLNILLVGLLSFFFLVELNFIDYPQILFDELLVSKCFQDFLLGLSSNVLLDLLFVLIYEIGMNRF
jgi:hypothetical protein